MKYLKTFRSSTIVFFLLTFMTFGASLAAAAELCKEGIKDLQASYDVVQGRGGLWGFLEQTGSLKDKSMLGLQADGKIQRGIVTFTDLCKNGKTPDMAVFKSLQDVIGDARMVFNMNERTPAKTILEAVTQVNQKADKILASMGQ